MKKKRLFLGDFDESFSLYFFITRLRLATYLLSSSTERPSLLNALIVYRTKNVCVLNVGLCECPHFLKRN
jgi:hypothetical protein